MGNSNSNGSPAKGDAATALADTRKQVESAKSSAILGCLSEEFRESFTKEILRRFDEATCPGTLKNALFRSIPEIVQTVCSNNEKDLRLFIAQTIQAVAKLLDEAPPGALSIWAESSKLATFDSSCENYAQCCISDSSSESDIAARVSRLDSFDRLVRVLLVYTLGLQNEIASQYDGLLPSTTQTETFREILDVPSVIYLCQNIPVVEHRQEWRLLFSTLLHGHSYGRLVRQVENEGSALIVVQDTDGYVFGGYAPMGLKCNGKFYGTEQCFLFQIHPHFTVYSSTGYNENYCYMNNNQETLPNGIGMGGQLEAHYFGLWIDGAELTLSGKSQQPCTTYNSKRLSCNEQFKVAELEIWAVQKRPPKEEEQGSVLDKDPEAKAMLSMIGKGPHSEGLRHLDSNADSPEDETLYPETPNSPSAEFNQRWTS